ncbi:MAG: glycosyltransferase [Lentisphaerae bacterium]|nr:glycosyltransferase [Lentisphaerota bacterium]
MKICDVVQFHSELSGGVKRYIHGKMRFLRQQPDVDHILVVPSSRNAEGTLLGSRVHEIKSHPLPGSESYRALVSRKQILRILTEEKPDVIEIDSPYRSAWIAVEAARLTGARMTAFYHSDFPRALDGTCRKYVGRHIATILSRKVDRYLLNLYGRMDTTFVASKRYEKVLLRMGVRPVVQIPLCVDSDDFRAVDSRDRIRCELGIDPKATFLLYVGRIAGEKNVVNLLDMMDCFNPEDGPVHLVLVGDGEQQRRVRRIAASRADITRLGFCTDTTRLSELYSAADLFVHAGCSETFGLVSLEAQACGTRVLAVSGGGLDETLEHEPVPVLAESPSPGDLLVGVNRALALNETGEDRRLRRERIVSLFPPENTYGKLLSAYRSILHGKPPDPADTRRET